MFVRLKTIPTFIRLFFLSALILACNLPQPGNKELAANQDFVPVTTPMLDTSTVAPPTPAPEEIDAPTPQHIETPEEAEQKLQALHDQVSKEYASQKRTYGGDEYDKNRFERPFDQNMGYLPFIDISQANLGREEKSKWLYFKIRLEENPTLYKDQKPVYGIEVDVDLDGRGDFLISTGVPEGTSWSVRGVQVFSDANENVGGRTPIASDENGDKGDGYELQLFDSGQGIDPDLAWSRLEPEIPNTIEIAVKLSLIGSDSRQIFLWGAFAASGQNGKIIFDLNDQFTLAEAGSPLKELNTYYPLKAFYAFDNTCRAASGFTPAGGEPGICTVPPPPQPGGDEPPPKAPPPPPPPPPIIIH